MLPSGLSQATAHSAIRTRLFSRQSKCEASIDRRTLEAYDGQAAEFAQQYAAWVPDSVYRLVCETFHPGRPTVDIGCGCGRDVDWLNRNGYPARGYDASAAMLDQARAAHPGLCFERAVLPELLEVPDSSFDNLLCSAVLMHLPDAELGTAVASLGRALRSGGRLVLSIRGTSGGVEREPDGRLFTPITVSALSSLLVQSEFRVLRCEEEADTARPGLEWILLAAEKCG